MAVVVAVVVVVVPMMHHGEEVDEVEDTKSHLMGMYFIERKVGGSSGAVVESDDGLDVNCAVMM